MDEFERELDAPPATRWEHTPNPLIGTLTSRYTFTAGEFEPAEVLVIQPAGSEVAYTVLCGKVTLRSFIERKDPKVGDIVGIKYAGEAESKRNGKSYAVYNGAVKRTEASEGQRGGEETEEALPF